MFLSVSGLLHLHRRASLPRWRLSSPVAHGLLAERGRGALVREEDRPMAMLHLPSWSWLVGVGGK